MNKQLFEMYSIVREQKKQLENEEKELAQKIKDEMSGEDVDKVNSDFGTFSLRTQKTYAFSEKVDALKEKLDKAKEKEIMNGTAKVKAESKVLTFRQAK